jgi:hypothetical protein
MANIKGISGMTPQEISFELNRGAKFVRYRYCVSVLVLTLLRGTDIYFVPAKDSRISKGLPWTLLTLLAGWWGIPWGPIRSIQSLVINLRGGDDLTAAVSQTMGLANLAPAATAAAAGSSTK